MKTLNEEQEGVGHMSTMVSARIPNDVYDRGIKNLKRMDSNVTDLVRAAFEYVSQTEKLPGQDDAVPKQGIRKLTKKQMQEFGSMFGNAESEIDLPDNFDYKREMLQCKRRDYEAIS